MVYGMNRLRSSLATSRSLAITTVLLLAACSMTAQARRDARLRADLDAHVFHLPLRVVWPVALHLLADHGYQLVGRDRLVVGAPPAGRFKRLTAGYRLEGSEIGGKSCRLVFIAIRRTGLSPAEERSRDLDMELELARRVEPDEAARIQAASGG